MVLYSLLVATIILLLVVTKNHRYLHTVALFISFILLWLVAGFRDVSVGNDTDAYVGFFQAVSLQGSEVLLSIPFPNVFVPLGFENGFLLINFALSRLTSDYTIYMLVSYAFIYFSFFVYIKRYSNDYIMSTIITLSCFFFISMSMMRQAIAMAIILWGVRYIYERKFFKYLTFILLAVLIHQASIVLIAPYFMYKHRIKIKNVMGYLLITAGAFLVVDKLIYYFADANFRYGFYIERIGSYSLGSFIVFFMYLIFAVTLYVIYRRNTKIDSFTEDELTKQSFYVKMALVATMTSAIAINVNALSRFTVFFIIFLIIAIPNFLSDKKSTLKYANSIKMIFALIFLSYCAIILIYKPEWYGIANYIINTDLMRS